MLEKIRIGIDLVKIDKFKKIPYSNNKTFYKKLFSNLEIDYCSKFSNPYEHFSGKFAIKEAVKKSIKENISMKEIITEHVDSKPSVKILSNSNYFFKVSLSHEDDIAVAVVISEEIL